MKHLLEEYFDYQHEHGRSLGEITNWHSCTLKKPLGKHPVGTKVPMICFPMYEEGELSIILCFAKDETGFWTDTDTIDFKLTLEEVRHDQTSKADSPQQ